MIWQSKSENDKVKNFLHPSRVPVQEFSDSQQPDFSNMDSTLDVKYTCRVALSAHEEYSSLNHICSHFLMDLH